MRIRSITDAITNSSNESFITRKAPIGYKYESYDELTWERILKGHSCLFSRDRMVEILEDHIINGVIVDNPFPRTSSQDKPWQQAYDNGWWTEEELDGLWQIFVKAYEPEFKKLVGYCYVSGPYDHDYHDYDEWESDTDALRDIAVICLGR